MSPTEKRVAIPHCISQLPLNLFREVLVLHDATQSVKLKTNHKQHMQKLYQYVHMPLCFRPSQNKMSSSDCNIAESSALKSPTPSKHIASDNGSESISNESKCCCWLVGVGAGAPVLGSGCFLSLLLDSPWLVSAGQQRKSKVNTYRVKSCRPSLLHTGSTCRR